MIGLLIALEQCCRGRDARGTRAGPRAPRISAPNAYPGLSTERTKVIEVLKSQMPKQ